MADNIREIRRERLLQLVQAQPGRGKQRSLAALIDKAPAQVSQWINRTRTITEDIARQIEIKARKPAGWLDHDPAEPPATGSYVLNTPPLAARQRSPAPPPPTRDFSDRRHVSATDWALLQDIKTAATAEELAAIRDRALIIKTKVEEMMAERIAAATDHPAQSPPAAPPPATPPSKKKGRPP